MDGITDSMDMSWRKHREGQGSLVCCSPWGRRESDVTEQLNNSNKFTRAPFIRAKMWKQPKCPLTMNGSAKCVTNTILLFNIKKEVLTCATKWIDLGDIVLTEASHKKTNTAQSVYMKYLELSSTQNRKNWGARGWGRWKWGVITQWCIGFQFCKMRKFWR